MSSFDVGKVIACVEICRTEPEVKILLGYFDSQLTEIKTITAPDFEKVLAANGVAGNLRRKAIHVFRLLADGWGGQSPRAGLKFAKFSMGRKGHPSRLEMLVPSKALAE